MFKHKNGKKIDDHIKYIENRLNNDPTLELHLAIDSKRKRHNRTCYVVAVVLYSPSNRNGGNVIHFKESIKTPNSMFERLWREVELAVEHSQILYKGLMNILKDPKKLHVHMDLNSNPKYGSYSVYKAGYPNLKGLGFDVLSKPLSWASKVADNLTR